MVGEKWNLKKEFAKKNFKKNTVTDPSFPDEKKKKTVAETSFDWNLIFSRETKKQKKN